MDTTTLRARQARVRAAMQAIGADTLLVPASADFTWLTGAVARSTERLVSLTLPVSGEPFCVVPRLESRALAQECPWLELEIWDDGEDAFERLSKRANFERKPSLLVAEGFRVVYVLRLAAACPCRPAAEVMSPLRAVKDAAELHCLEEAGLHADRVVEETADHMRAGMTERQLARFATERFVELGDTEPWAIVASGPNGALPHHMTSDRVLQEGDVVVLDLGAYTRGYGSDITRTYWLGAPGDEARRVYDVVHEAQGRGVEAARAGVAAQDVDRAARGVIERAGLAEYFTHRTGHGVGLEVHEAPYLVAGNTAPLEAGMVHSVEPGIYLPGRFGVRLEDLVVVEAGGARRLNRAPFDPRPPRTR